ncbi:MAG: hypothetical protein ABI277_18315 [Burkholderiaceae bacterium]
MHAIRCAPRHAIGSDKRSMAAGWWQRIAAPMEDATTMSGGRDSFRRVGARTRSSVNCGRRALQRPSGSRPSPIEISIIEARHDIRLHICRIDTRYRCRDRSGDRYLLIACKGGGDHTGRRDQRGGSHVAHHRAAVGNPGHRLGVSLPPLDKAGLPTVTVASEKTMAFEGETILIRYYGPGHTDSDLTVYFKNADVLQVGDIWWNGHYPFIDYSAGGDIDGVIHEVAECIKASTDETIIVPGHGPVSNRADLIEFHRMLTTIRNNVAALKKQGKTLSETVAAKPTAAFDAKFGTFPTDPAFFTQLVYTGV